MMEDELVCCGMVLLLLGICTSWGGVAYLGNEITLLKKDMAEKRNMDRTCLSRFETSETQLRQLSLQYNDLKEIQDKHKKLQKYTDVLISELTDKAKLNENAISLLLRELDDTAKKLNATLQQLCQSTDITDVRLSRVEEDFRNIRRIIVQQSYFSPAFEENMTCPYPSNLQRRIQNLEGMLTEVTDKLDTNKDILEKHNRTLYHIVLPNLFNKEAVSSAAVLTILLIIACFLWFKWNGRREVTRQHRKWTLSSQTE